MLDIAVITLFPEMFTALTEYGISGKAHRNGLFNLRSWNPRDFTSDVHKTVDDRPYGGGAGMVMLYQPIADSINAAKQAGKGKPAKVIYLSPQGRRLTQSAVLELADESVQLILLAGRYEGIDERIVENLVDEEWSIGDYVLSGGELGAMVMIDAMVRTLPNALGHVDSAKQDSFTDSRLEYPHYTRPEQIDGLAVPEILLSGNHAAIESWRCQQSILRTLQRRPDLLENAPLSQAEQTLLNKQE